MFLNLVNYKFEIISSQLLANKMFLLDTQTQHSVIKLRCRESKVLGQFLFAFKTVFSCFQRTRPKVQIKPKIVFAKPVVNNGRYHAGQNEGRGTAVGVQNLLKLCRQI